MSPSPAPRTAPSSPLVDIGGWTGGVGLASCLKSGGCVILTKPRPSDSPNPNPSHNPSPKPRNYHVASFIRFR